MSAFQEALRASFLFFLALVVIPTGIFLSDILENYYRKERLNCDDHDHDDE